jgi:hypothetical protein
MLVPWCRSIEARTTPLQFIGRDLDVKSPQLDVDFNDVTIAH